MNAPFDRRKSLQQLEGANWGSPDFNSNLVRTCHRLRQIPVQELTVEDLRILIGQEIGLSFLLPLAIEVLVEDPLAAGDHYPGDLLCAVLRVPSATWANNVELRESLGQVIANAQTALDRAPDNDDQRLRAELLDVRALL
jgi:hypothetical protein